MVNIQKTKEEQIALILKNVKKSGSIKIHTSLSEVPSLIEKIENKIDIPRIAFTLTALSLYYSKYNIDQVVLQKFETVFSFVSQSKDSESLTKHEMLFTALYLLRSAIYLRKDKKLVNCHLEHFKSMFFSLENIYSQPLLANKIVSFYEEFKNFLDLSELDKPAANIKSVMVYLISSSVSEKFPFFYFADMLVWSKNTSCSSKVNAYMENKLKKVDLAKVSTSGLAYVVECKLRTGGEIDKTLWEYIDMCKLTEEDYYITDKRTPCGLYLNTRYENFCCLDTNTHILLGLLQSKLYE